MNRGREGRVPQPAVQRANGMANAVIRLAVPLAPAAIQRAGRIRLLLTQWVTTDQTLEEASARFPEFDAVSTLLKVVTLNALYGTNVYAVDRMARHIQVIARTELQAAGLELVEQIAALPARNGETQRMFLSFASKFAHFFVDSDRFPILDSVAENMVKWHLGKPNLAPGGSGRYRSFVQNLARLRELSQWSGSSRELDRYLWLAGQYRAWRRNRNARINIELQRFFAEPPADAAADLNALLPATPADAFRGRR